MRDGVPRWQLAAGFGAIYLLWGSTFLAIRYAVEAVPPFVTIAVRCIAGALVLYLWLLARGRLAPAGRRQWLAAAVAGALLFVGGHAALAWAEQRVPSGRAALLLATIPLWLAVLEAVRRRALPAPPVLAGLVLGTAGVALLGGAGGESGSATAADHLLLVGAALAWAVGSLVARQGLSALPALQSTAMQLAVGGVLVTAASLAAGELSGWSPALVPPRAAGALAYLVVGGTVVGFAAYTWLLRVASPEAVGTYGFVNPIVALALAWWSGDETASVLTGVAAALVLGAVLLIRRAPVRTAAAAVSFGADARRAAAGAIRRPHGRRVPTRRTSAFSSPGR